MSTMNPPTVNDLTQWRRNGNYDSMLALCNECGAVRRTSRPRGRDHQRETGQLKCDACARITVHALIRGNDNDEARHALALGMPSPYTGKTASPKFMDDWRRGMPRNPRLGHIWLESVERKAIEARAPKMRALCGEMVTTPKRAEDTNSVPLEDRAPRYDERDWERTDADGWQYMECVNCVRVHNHMEAVRRRKTLADLMTTALAELLDRPRAGIYDAHSQALIDLLRAVHDENG